MVGLAAIINLRRSLLSLHINNSLGQKLQPAQRKALMTPVGCASGCSKGKKDSVQKSSQKYTQLHGAMAGHFPAAEQFNSPVQNSLLVCASLGIISVACEVSSLPLSAWFLGMCFFFFQPTLSVSVAHLILACIGPAASLLSQTLSPGLMCSSNAVIYLYLLYFT